MPIHDWTKVDAGIFHDFHMGWLVYLRNAIKRVLPAGYTALTEQRAMEYEIDVLTLQHGPKPEAALSQNGSGHSNGRAEGGISVATAPPKVLLSRTAAVPEVQYKQRRIAVRHVTSKKVVAIVEVVSPGNKSSQDAIRSFTAKIAEFLELGVHALIIDLFPPSGRDPDGIHQAIWGDRAGDFKLRPDAPLTLVSYVAGDPQRAYIQPAAVGSELPEMPLFLSADRYVNVPLQPSYSTAFADVDEEWRTAVSTPAS